MIRKLPILILVLISGLSYADQTKTRMDQLENNIKSMQNESTERNVKAAQALEAVERIKTDYQSVQGTLEANTHQINEQQEDLNRFKNDMNARLSALEERLEIYGQQITKAVAKISPEAVSETESYEAGLKLVHETDYLSAVAAFRKFLKGYPKSTLADNAQYWIGECYYALKDYNKAIKEFQILSDKYPKSDKIPGAVLKQGYSFSEMGMLEEARLFLNKVVTTYPTDDTAAKAREKLVQLDKAAAMPAPVSNIPLAPGAKQSITNNQAPTTK